MPKPTKNDEAPAAEAEQPEARPAGRETTLPMQGGDPMPEPDTSPVMLLAIDLAKSQGYPNPTSGDLGCGRPISYITMAEMLIAFTAHQNGEEVTLG